MQALHRGEQGRDFAKRQIAGNIGKARRVAGDGMIDQFEGRKAEYDHGGARNGVFVLKTHVDTGNEIDLSELVLRDDVGREFGLKRAGLPDREVPFVLML